MPYIPADTHADRNQTHTDNTNKHTKTHAHTQTETHTGTHTHTMAFLPSNLLQNTIIVCATSQLFVSSPSSYLITSSCLPILTSSDIFSSHFHFLLFSHLLTSSGIFPVLTSSYSILHRPRSSHLEARGSANKTPTIEISSKYFSGVEDSNFFNQYKIIFFLELS